MEVINEARQIPLWQRAYIKEVRKLRSRRFMMVGMLLLVFTSLWWIYCSALFMSADGAEKTLRAERYNEDQLDEDAKLLNSHRDVHVCGWNDSHLNGSAALSSSTVVDLTNRAIECCRSATNWCTRNGTTAARTALPVCTRASDYIDGGCWTQSPNEQTITQWHPRSCHYTLDRDIALSVLGKVRWIYFLGDSTTRGQYCELAILLLGGTSNQLESAGCDPAETESSDREMFWTVPIENRTDSTKISFTFAKELADTVSMRTMLRLMNMPPSSRPDAIFYNSGAWEHAAKWEETYLMRMGAVRAAGSNFLLTMAESAGFKGLLAYRNNHCNTRFSSRYYDHEVEQAWIRNGHIVIDAFSLSLGRMLDSAFDGFHIDRSRRSYTEVIWRTMPNVGTLNRAVLAASLLAVEEHKRVVTR